MAKRVTAGVVVTAVAPLLASLGASLLEAWGAARAGLGAGQVVVVSSGAARLLAISAKEVGFETEGKFPGEGADGEGGAARGTTSE